MSGLSITLPPAALEAIAQRAAEILASQQQAPAASPWLTTDEAADYLRAARQRVFDLTSQRRLKVQKDGSRNLYRREDLDAYLRGES
jgi:excisionase family DNA binding protein